MAWSHKYVVLEAFVTWGLLPGLAGELTSAGLLSFFSVLSRLLPPDIWLCTILFNKELLKGGINS